MNDETESFERRLKRQPLRRVPAEWREEILSAASETQCSRQSTAAAEDSFLSNLNRRLASLLWPHPVAWTGLVAVWIFVFAVKYSIRDTQPAIAEKAAPPSPEVLAELQQQQRLYAELLDANTSDSSDADRQKIFVPRPRSERVEFLSA